MSDVRRVTVCERIIKRLCGDALADGAEEMGVEDDTKHERCGDVLVAALKSREDGYLNRLADSGSFLHVLHCYIASGNPSLHALALRLLPWYAAVCEEAPWAPLRGACPAAVVDATLHGPATGDVRCTCLGHGAGGGDCTVFDLAMVGPTPHLKVSCAQACALRDLLSSSSRCLAGTTARHLLDQRSCALYVRLCEAVVSPSHHVSRSAAQALSRLLFAVDAAALPDGSVTPCQAGTICDTARAVLGIGDACDPTRATGAAGSYFPLCDFLGDFLPLHPQRNPCCERRCRTALVSDALLVCVRELKNTDDRILAVRLQETLGLALAVVHRVDPARRPPGASPPVAAAGAASGAAGTEPDARRAGGAREDLDSLALSTAVVLMSPAETRAMQCRGVRLLSVLGWGARAGEAVSRTLQAMQADPTPDRELYRAAARTFAALGGTALPRLPRGVADAALVRWAEGLQRDLAGDSGCPHEERVAAVLAHVVEWYGSAVPVMGSCWTRRAVRRAELGLMDAVAAAAGSAGARGGRVIQAWGCMVDSVCGGIERAGDRQDLFARHFLALGRAAEDVEEEVLGVLSSLAPRHEAMVEALIGSNFHAALVRAVAAGPIGVQCGAVLWASALLDTAAGRAYLAEPTQMRAADHLATILGVLVPRLVAHPSERPRREVTALVHHAVRVGACALVTVSELLHPGEAGAARGVGEGAFLSSALRTLNCGWQQDPDWVVKEIAATIGEAVWARVAGDAPGCCGCGTCVAIEWGLLFAEGGFADLLMSGAATDPDTVSQRRAADVLARIAGTNLCHRRAGHTRTTLEEIAERARSYVSQCGGAVCGEDGDDDFDLDFLEPVRLRNDDESLLSGTDEDDSLDDEDIIDCY